MLLPPEPLPLGLDLLALLVDIGDAFGFETTGFFPDSFAGAGDDDDADDALVLHFALMDDSIVEGMPLSLLFCLDVELPAACLGLEASATCFGLEFAAGCREVELKGGFPCAEAGWLC